MSEKIQLKNKRIQNMDEYHYIGIPKSFIDNGILSKNKKYNVFFEESKDNNVDKSKKGKDLVKTNTEA